MQHFDVMYFDDDLHRTVQYIFCGVVLISETIHYDARMYTGGVCMLLAPNLIKSRGARLLGQGSANFDKVQLSSFIAWFQSIAFGARISSRESLKIPHYQ